MIMKKSYNTVSKPLILPEYGRHIQNMVDYCIQLEDKKERQLCAESIIATMNMVSTRDKESKDHNQVLWDHLYIMSNFKLDIDFPMKSPLKRSTIPTSLMLLTMTTKRSQYIDTMGGSLNA